MTKHLIYLHKISQKWQKFIFFAVDFGITSKFSQNYCLIKAKCHKLPSYFDYFCDCIKEPVNGYKKSNVCLKKPEILSHVDRLLTIMNPKFPLLTIMLDDNKRSKIELGFTEDYSYRDGKFKVYSGAYNADKKTVDTTIQHEINHWLYGTKDHSSRGGYQDASVWGGGYGVFGGGIYGKEIFGKGQKE